MKIISITKLCLLTICLLLKFIHNSCGQGAYHQVKGARSNALANQSVAIGGIDGLVSNPATLGNITTASISLCAETRIAGSGIKGSSFVGVLPIQQRGAVEIGGEFYGLPEYNQQIYKVGYGRKLTDHWTVGSAMEYLAYHTSQRDPVSLGVLQIGTQYDMNKIGVATAVFVPMTPRTHQDQLNGSVWLAGLKYKVSDPVTLYVEVEKEQKFDANIKVAMQYEFLKELILRIGITNGPASFSVGLGTLVNKKFGIDISTVFYQHLGVSPALSLHYILNKSTQDIE